MAVLEAPRLPADSEAVGSAEAVPAALRADLVEPRPAGQVLAAASLAADEAEILVSAVSAAAQALAVSVNQVAHNSTTF